MEIILDNRMKNSNYNYDIGGVIINKDTGGTYNVKNSDNTFESIMSRRVTLDKSRKFSAGNNQNNKFIDYKI